MLYMVHVVNLVYVSVLVESNALGFVLELLLWYECCDGCEGFTHPWGEGVSWACH